MRAAGEPGVGLSPQTAAIPVAAGALAFCALFFSGGFADAPLVWIGGIALVLAAALAAAASVGALSPVRLEPAAGAFAGCLLGLAVWAGATTLWSVSPDRSWTYANRTLVYAAFGLVGVLVARSVSRRAAAAGVALLLGLVLGWALLAKCVPALYGDYGRIARLRAPVAYWNELALLCDVAVPLGLWLAAPRARSAAARAAGVLLLFAATVTLLLTYSRVGVVLACAVAAAWVVLDADRVESLAALALGGGAGAAAFGVALALPGITSDGQTHAVRVHDGWIFALVLVAGAVLVAAAAAGLARLEGRRPLAAAPRARIERIAAVAAVVLALAGVAVAIVFASRIWHSFANPVSSQIASTPGHIASFNSSNRWRWWQEEWQAFTAHPAGGTGAGTFELTDQRLRRSPLVATEPHNVPLQFLGETGIVGFLLYLGLTAAAAVAVLRARRRATGAERAAVTALGLGVAAFFAHTVVDMDWNFVATCGPLLLVTGVLVAGGPVREPRAVAFRRRPVLALGAVLFALAGVYSLTAPWLAQRQLATAVTAADAKRAHSYDPLSTDALTTWAAFEEGAGHLKRAEQLYRQAVSLEQSSETWYDLGLFYWEHDAPKPAYAALSEAWALNRLGPAGTPCGPLDQARHAVLHVWPPSCPRGRPRASTP